MGVSGERPRGQRLDRRCQPVDAQADDHRLLMRRLLRHRGAAPPDLERAAAAGIEDPAARVALDQRPAQHAAGEVAEALDVLGEAADPGDSQWLEHGGGEEACVHCGRPGGPRQGWPPRAWRWPSGQPGMLRDRPAVVEVHLHPHGPEGRGPGLRGALPTRRALVGRDAPGTEDPCGVRPLPAGARPPASSPDRVHPMKPRSRCRASKLARFGNTSSS